MVSAETSAATKTNGHCKEGAFLGKVQLALRAPDGSFTISHLQHGRLQSVTRKDATGNQLARTTFTYDAHGRTSTSIDARNGATSDTYDAADRRIATRTPTPGNGQNAQTTTFTYDWAGRITQAVLPDNAVVYNAYSQKGELLTNYGARVYPVSYAYDPQGRRTNMVTWTNFATRAGAAITCWKFDGLRGFMTNKLYADGKGPSYTYTAGGKLRTRKWARGITTTYETNGAGDIIGITYSDGTTSNVTYHLDRLGRRTNIFDGAGSRMLSYSASGLLLLETNTSGVLAGTAIGYQYDQLNRRTNLAIHTPSSIINHSYAYDTASRLSTVFDGTYNATYDYLANSPLVSQITFRSNTTTRMTTTKKYDFLNRLIIVSVAPSAESATAFSYTYDDASQWLRRNDSDSTFWEYGYDSLGQLTTAKRHWPDGALVAGQQFEYDFDDIANRRNVRAGGDQLGGALRPSYFVVNALNEATQRSVPGAIDVIGIAHPSAAVTINAQSTYRRGEYYQKAVSINNSSAAVWQSVTNQAVLSGQTNTDTGNVFLPKDAESLLYDLDGNLISDGRWTNRWNAQNQILQMEGLPSTPAAAQKKLVFTFDSHGRRVSKTVSNWTGTTWTNACQVSFLYDGWNIVSELDSSSTIVRDYLWGPGTVGELPNTGGVGSLVKVNDAAEQHHFVAYDGSGNVASTISAINGRTSGRWEYGAFGERIRASGALAERNAFTFSTKYLDFETGLLCYGYRFYSPDFGRWLGRDPLGESEDLNLYAFIKTPQFSDWNGLFTLYGPYWYYGQYESGGVIGPAAGAAGMVQWRAGLRDDLFKTEVRGPGRRLCCLTQADYWLRLSVFVSIEGDPIGAGKFATESQALNILKHEEMHLEHSMALSGRIFPKIENECVGKCYKKPLCQAWTEDECHGRWIGQMLAYVPQVTSWNEELGRDWHTVHGGPPSIFNTFATLIDKPVTPKKIEDFRKIYNVKISNWEKGPWCPDAERP